MELEARISEAFREEFGQAPAYLVKTPGRVNLIGEHTDYNGGFVFPFAIDKHICLAAARSESGSRLHAVDLGESVEFNAHSLPEPRPGHWSNYLIGVMAQFQQRKITLPQLHISFGGNVPQGGGLSSSAAIENCVAILLQEATGTRFSRPELAALSQAAEHRYAGVNCGIMDQFITMMGQEGAGIKLDCRSLEYTVVDLDIAPYRFVLCNTNVKHELSSSEYNQRRRECEEALACLRRNDPGLLDLRDVGQEYLKSMKAELTDVQYRRALHQVQENLRVHGAEKALRTGNIKLLGELMHSSHQSLDAYFEVTCPELNLLVELAMSQESCLGARMTGGGFGGNTINLVHQDHIDVFQHDVSEAYRSQTGIEPTILPCSPSSGSKLTHIQRLGEKAQG